MNDALRLEILFFVQIHSTFFCYSKAVCGVALGSILKLNLHHFTMASTGHACYQHFLYFFCILLKFGMLRYRGMVAQQYHRGVARIFQRGVTVCQTLSSWRFRQGIL